MYQITIKQTFPFPVRQVFSALSDHERFGRIIGQKITRIVESPDNDKNGLGSVRRIALAPGLSFEETVTAYTPDTLFEYKVTRGSPIKDHVGRMHFTQRDGSTELVYTIEFRPKLPLPGLGQLLSKMIRKPIEKGLSELAQSAGQ